MSETVYRWYNLSEFKGQLPLVLYVSIILGSCTDLDFMMVTLLMVAEFHSQKGGWHLL
jgi:hypothetical protein